jgi:alpha-galactosidase
MQFAKTILHYDNQTVEFPLNKLTFFDELYVDFKRVDHGNYQTYHLAIHPKKTIQIKKLSLVFNHDYLLSNDPRIFCNGYQSWSESREYQIKEKLPNLKSWAKNHKYIGDHHIKEIPRGKNIFHSWTYTYVKNKNYITFLGSLKENAAFTYFIHDGNSQQLVVEKDCNGLELSHSFPILDLFVSHGKENSVFNQWKSEMNLSAIKAKTATGWTSWNNYFNNISEKTILKNINAFHEKNTPLDYIQIDDGYQTQVGDWLSIKSTFPNGMAQVAQKIKQANYKPGIWLAPFICDAQSVIFKQKKHWLVKDKNGKPFAAGKIKLWGGKFYVLDFYHKEVQNYLIQVIRTFIKKWGFEFLKLDFLYAVCIFPKKNKTRGQIMHDAVEFLRTQAGGKIIIGGGVPLGSAFGKVDFCRIGSDVHLQWENKYQRLKGNRERTSTLLSLRSTIGRWQLSNRVFLNNPGVFILREKTNKLTPTQQYTLLIINILCGDLIFTSDFVRDYSAEQWGEYMLTNQLQNSEVKEIQNLTNDKYLISFINRGKRFVAACNLSNKKTTFLVKRQQIALESFESIILKS